MEASDTSVWVVVSRQRKLYRLNPKTGRRQGSSVSLPMQPTSVAVTSRSIWVGLLTDDHTNDELAQIDRRTGEIARTIPMPEGISALAAGDGAIWIANRRRSLVSRFDPRKLAVTRRIPVGSDRPFAIAFGAGAVWVSSPQDGLVTRIDPRSFGTTEIGVGRNPRGIAVRGQDVFVANKTDNTVTRIDARSRRTVGEPIQACLNPFALTIEGGSVWVTCQPRDQVVQIRYEPLTDRAG